jgi:hypothetical protein
MMIDPFQKVWVARKLGSLDFSTRAVDECLGDFATIDSEYC